MHANSPPAAAPVVVDHVAALRAAVAQARAAGRKIGLVPTMGALHEGHLSLVDASRGQCGCTVVTIFVNPAQFGPQEDFSRYPRTIEADLQQLAQRGADLVFVPGESEVYPPGHCTYVEMQGPALPWEGVCRPGHFRGVATVVLKLFEMVQPDVAYFGRKDYQQCCVIEQLVRDFNLPIELRICPTVREADGLAMSSRNRYLSSDERRQALVLHRALQHASQQVAAGMRDAVGLREELATLIAAEPGVRLQYLAIADPRSLAELSTIDQPAVALVAAYVGSTRLIDNEPLLPPPLPNR
jgi:pantoate--beta-alanine ligase